MVDVEIGESSKPVDDITQLLVAWSEGDTKALERLARAWLYREILAGRAPLEPRGRSSADSP
jgi:hypothetical protein